MTPEQEIRVKALEIAAASLPSTARSALKQRAEDLKEYAGLIERYILESGGDQNKQ
jgi:hypothetical protein